MFACFKCFYKDLARFTVEWFAIPLIQNCQLIFYFVFIYLIIFILFQFFILLRTSVWLMYSCIKNCIHKPLLCRKVWSRINEICTLNKIALNLNQVFFTSKLSKMFLKTLNHLSSRSLKISYQKSNQSKI